MCLDVKVNNRWQFMLNLRTLMLVGSKYFCGVSVSDFLNILFKFAAKPHGMTCSVTVPAGLVYTSGA